MWIRKLPKIISLLVAILIGIRSIAYSDPLTVTLSDGRIITIVAWNTSFMPDDPTACGSIFDLTIPTRDGELLDYFVSALGRRNDGNLDLAQFDILPREPKDWPKLKGSLGPKNCMKVMQEGLVPIWALDGIIAEDGIVTILPGQHRAKSRSQNGPTRQGYDTSHGLQFQCSPELLEGLRKESLDSLLSGGDISSGGSSIDAAISLTEGEFIDLPPGLGALDETQIPKIPSALPCDDFIRLRAPDPAPGGDSVPGTPRPPVPDPPSGLGRIIRILD